MAGCGVAGGLNGVGEERNYVIASLLARDDDGERPLDEPAPAFRICAVAYLVTSYDAVRSGSIVNRGQRANNGLGQMVTEWQGHGGAVNTSTSPKVQYAYNFNSSGTTNQSRLTSITHPSGYVLGYN